MNTSAKIEIKKLFEERFNKQAFSKFIINLLNEFVPDSGFDSLRGQYIKAPFRDGIVEYERVCKYIDPLKNQIDVLIVKLDSKNKLDNARTFQRNFVVDYLNGGRGGKLKDGALVAFYSEDSADWRFSFVKLEYELKVIEGKIHEEKIMTSAKRYSFLVGENENSHTAQSQLLPLLIEDESNPTLKQIESAFSIETVTKEFFEKYKELFLKVKAELDRIVECDPMVKSDFELKEINTADFSKKLLGQIVFLYFLQKKGWFGVERDKPWGSGSKKFLRDLYNGKVIRYTNFFNDVLEPLFYEALANDRSAYDHFSSHFNSRIPFLNGGLFDPIGNYDWIKTDITIANDLFSNEYISQDKFNDIGTGILDIFERYNFTVREDEPLEKEVAIDPEMLGKVFENMLDINDRKSKGTYYTPREIVHYMCQESLINYLSEKLGNSVDVQDLTFLVKRAEYAKEKYNSDSDNITKYHDLIPNSLIKHAPQIDSLLEDIKVLDPAIGSGAFPVGMMNEIVKVRSILTPYLTKNLLRTEYEFKLHAIANSLHGVDIDPGAVEIAKLRLWLSLIVDEDSITNIKPLPNLDYKIMQGDSLVEEYSGIRLFDDSLLQVDDSKEKDKRLLEEMQDEAQRSYISAYRKGNSYNIEKYRAELNQIKKRLDILSINKGSRNDSEQIDFFVQKDELQERSAQLLKLQRRFFETSQKSEKEKLKLQIESIIWDLVEFSVKEENFVHKLEHIRKIRKSNNKPFFIWKLNFSDVFKQQSGFDIVIGNPPYGEVKDKQMKAIFQRNFSTAYFKIDTYALFIEKAIMLCRTGGSVALIVPYTWLSINQFQRLRDKVFALGVKKIVDLSYKVFESADLDTIVLILTNESNIGGMTSIVNISGDNEITSRKLLLKGSEILKLGQSNNSIEIIEKVRSFPSISSLGIFEVCQGFIPYSRPELVKKFGEEKGNSIIDNREWHSQTYSKGYYKELRGVDIKKYQIEWSGQYVKYGDWLHAPRERKFFVQPRIIVREITRSQICAAYTEEEYYNSPVGINIINTEIVKSHDSLLGLLAVINSRLFNYYHIKANPKGSAVTSIPKILIGDIRLIPCNVEILNDNELIKYVKELNSIYLNSSIKTGIEMQSLVNRLRAQIDERVYELYKINNEEKALIESEVAKINK